MPVESESPKPEDTAPPEQPQSAVRGSISLRTSLARSLMLMIFVSAGVILVVSYRFSSHVVEDLSEKLIQQQLDNTSMALENFFLPIESDLQLFRQWGDAGLLEPVEIGAIVKQNPDISVLVAGDQSGKYNGVYQALTDLQQAGVSKVGLMSTPESGKPNARP